MAACQPEHAGDYGILLFIVANHTRASMVDIVRDITPFIVVLVAALFFLTYAPDVVLWLPRQFGYSG